MVGLVICKTEEDPSKNEGTRVVTTFSHYKSMGMFSRRSRAANSYVPGQILPIFKSIRDIIVALVSCKNKEKKNNQKMKELEWLQDFPHYNP